VTFIFDLDGVIVHSMPLHTQAWRVYLQRLGKPRADVAERMHGRRNDEIVREWLGPDLTDAEVFSHGAAKESLYREMLEPGIKGHLVPGVREFLERYEWVNKAIASNAERANIDLVLDGTDLRHHFSVVVDGNQVQRPKPYPDIYLRAAELLGSVAPKECVVFEDSPAGVEAGLGSGAKVVGVLTHPTTLNGVDLLIQDFNDPALPEWLARICP
jgi:beta-phosphoglucomutase